MAENLEWWTIFIGGIATLAIYSFLIKENAFYRFFEHLFIGIATAITTSIAFRTTIWPKFIKPMLGHDVVIFPDGTIGPEYQYQSWTLFYLFPIAIGLLYYCILSKKHAWMAQIPIGIALGHGAGNYFKAFFNQLMPQLYDSFKPLHVAGEGISLNNLIFITVMLGSFFYFFFTFKRRKGGAVERFSSMGRWMMMGCFGAFFGSTIMARMALLVERVQFFIDKWFPNVLPGLLS